MTDNERHWFTDEFLHERRLSDAERSFVADLSRLLERVAPGQVIPEQTHLTAEGHESLIAIIPHAALAGVSIVVWVSQGEISVSWAQIGDLSATHDDLDLGFWVGRFERIDPVSTWHADVLACVNEQLRRPIEVRTTYRDGIAEPIRSDFLLQDKGQKRALGRKRVRGMGMPGLRAHVRTESRLVRFIDHDPPVPAYRFDVRDWYRTSS